MGSSGTCCFNAFGCLSFFPLITAAASFSNETDRMALLEFKAMISSDPLGALSTWNDSAHFCQWYGVSCSKRHAGRVTVLDLHSQKLSGSISPHIGNLSFLKGLYLHNNSFSKGIPPQIGSLCRLQWLYLYNNSLTGEIPSSISSCSALTTLHVANNELFRELPRLFNGSLNRLEGFLVHLNNLTGSIPHSFGNLSSLQELSLGGNGLSGRVPNSLGRLKGLRHLQFDLNDLSGEIPASIFNISSLVRLTFAWNHFHGSLPKKLGFSLPNLADFAVFTNQLTGSVPASLSNATNLVTLQLQGNYFTGSMPCMASSQKLRLFVIHQNSMGSGGNDLSFISSLTNATGLEVLYINDNNFGGNFPKSIANLSTSLRFLDTSATKISGSIPYGIRNLVKLQKFDASHAYLSGTIPSSIGDLQTTELLDLSHNSISGFVPSSIGSLEDWLHPVGSSSTDEPPRCLHFHHRLNVAIDIAYALDYLHHQCGTPIVHCDLKPSNILLDEDKMSHVADFGLARFLSSSADDPSSVVEISSSIGIKGTIGYAPPEYGMGNEVSTQGGVYSFGILLLKMFTGRRPTDEIFSDDLNLQNFVQSALSQQHFPPEVLDPILLDELRIGQISKEVIISILKIGVACSTDSPQERPSISQVLARLKKPLA